MRLFEYRLYKGVIDAKEIEVAEKPKTYVRTDGRYFSYNSYVRLPKDNLEIVLHDYSGDYYYSFEQGKKSILIQGVLNREDYRLKSMKDGVIKQESLCAELENLLNEVIK